MDVVFPWTFILFSFRSNSNPQQMQKSVIVFNVMFLSPDNIWVIYALLTPIFFAIIVFGIFDISYAFLAIYSITIYNIINYEHTYHTNC
ncbi:MAG: hypothetical protein A2268_00785 [Candidatus Raymondbacteria bacterium RifOxyA12_full_50_37]|nr:MAG: hypothetical protein A2268_00785 [Candidatus Raymondbacteria bacterium RifOxyA12_full_50_37]OGJ92882.1 MAG: hypothetical protein A2487_09680 [Candidatus Raymondbacteria bacterium RifOxyC12_full_50_8]OGJ96706.1 MAG: hypothetical protein A2350_01970 [Candidatus Raymondbacteria bacterium RifOxyB12_full_50_8]OGJ96749.1 MAG: hypothetical protein A2453_06240 [Candidatus Raymondbacteria bacterium RIFOXYC2_FULL_50_21]